MPASLYQRVLGEEFERLPEALQRFHGSLEGGRVRGSFRVERGPGRVHVLLAELGRLPRAGEAVPLRLEVEVEGDEERWTRSFGPRRLRTRQYARGRRLIEVHRPWALHMRLRASSNGMQIDHERCTWCGIPLPHAIAPRVDTLVEARGAGWFVEVTIGLPLFGMVCRYSGEVQPA